MDLLIDLIIGSHLINIFGAFYVVFVCFNLFKQTKIKLILLLAGILLGWIVIQCIEIVLIFTVEEVLFIDLVALYNFLLIVIISLFLVFIDLFEGDLSPAKLVLASAAVSVSTILSILAIIKDPTILFSFIELNQFRSFNWSGIFSILLDPFIVIVGIITYHELSISLSYAISDHHKKQILKMRTGVTSIFFIATISETISIYLINNPAFESIGVILRFVVASLFIGIGMFYMGNAYSSSKQLSLLQPQKMDYLLVINKAGLPLFEYRFRNTESNQESILISGAIQAITILMREAFGISSNIRMIKFEDKDIAVKIQKEIAFLLVTERISFFLTKSLEMFSEKFTSQFKDKIDDFNGDSTIFDPSKDLMIISFGLPPLS